MYNASVNEKKDQRDINQIIKFEDFTQFVSITQNSYHVVKERLVMKREKTFPFLILLFCVLFLLEQVMRRMLTLLILIILYWTLKQ